MTVDHRNMFRSFWLLILALALSGCDQLKDRAGFVDPARVEAEGKAIGAACRHSGRGLEDCYRLNRNASKAAVFAGWKEMNEYMVKNNLEVMPPELGGPQASPSANPAEPTANPAEPSAPATDKATN